MRDWQQCDDCSYEVTARTYVSTHVDTHNVVFDNVFDEEPYVMYKKYCYLCIYVAVVRKQRLLMWRWNMRDWQQCDDCSYEVTARAYVSTHVGMEHGAKT